ENAVQYAISFAEDQIIHLENIPPYIREKSKKHRNKAMTLQEKNLMNEKKIIGDLLQKYGTSVAGKDKVAEVLGISRATLYRKIKKLGLNKPDKDLNGS
ncbi:MAG: helix-turn-helix domain-containing protein, partial [Thermacetogeniaceae bacterium]